MQSKKKIREWSIIQNNSSIPFVFTVAFGAKLLTIDCEERLISSSSCRLVAASDNVLINKRRKGYKVKPTINSPDLLFNEGDGVGGMVK